MAPYRGLLHAVEVALAGSSFAGALPGQLRADYLHALQLFKDDFRNLLVRPAPRAEDRAQVLRKEVQLPDAPPASLDDQDVQIVLKLSEDYNLNETDCVSLLVAAHQEYSIAGRPPLEIVRLAAGLWLTERRSLLTTLQLLLRLVVLEESGGDPSLVAATRAYVEELLAGGLRGRILALMRELNREEAAGMGGPQAEPYVMDARGALVRRSQVAQRERLLLAHCLLYSCLITRINPSEAREILGILKDTAQDWSQSPEAALLQIAYTTMFALVISLVSDSLAGDGGPPPLLATDAAFRKDFEAQVVTSPLASSSAGFLAVVRFAWGIFLSNTGPSGQAPPGSSPPETKAVRTCLDPATLVQAFKFLSEKVLRSATFQNDDPDLGYTCVAYLHRLLCCFLTHPVGRDIIKDLKEAAGRLPESHQGGRAQWAAQGSPSRLPEGQQAEAFLALMEVVGEVYQREPQLMEDNAALWTFVLFAGEEHRGHATMAAFLDLLTALATGEEGARQVYSWLQGPSFRMLSWATLLNTLLVYEQRFRAALTEAGAGGTAPGPALKGIPEGDVVVLEAYLKCLKKVVQQGPREDVAAWFPDLEPLFRLLPYSMVPPRLKGALRSAIGAFVSGGPALRDAIWALLEHYDMPVAAPNLPMPRGSAASQGWQKGYDLTWELTEVEARLEQYPSTLSYLELLNALIAAEPSSADQGRRYSGLFRFVRDRVLPGHAQRAFKDPSQKWGLAVAGLAHLVALLGMYAPSSAAAQPQGPGGVLTAGEDPSQAAGAPGEEIMQDLMSGKVVYRTVMAILALGPEAVLEERATQAHGALLEEAVRLCFRVLLLAFQKDTLLAARWRPNCQSLDVLLGYDARQMGVLLEYVRYDALAEIQHSSIQLMGILSARTPQLVALLVEGGAAERLPEDCAACLEARIQETGPAPPLDQDSGCLILKLLVEAVDRAAPNLAHLLLRFNVELAVERSVLEPKRNYSCLQVILNLLEEPQGSEANAFLRELSLELLYKLATDPITSGPTAELLRGPKYGFFVYLLEGAACQPLPRRSTQQPLRTSSLQQRAWLLKLLTLALHTADTGVQQQRAMCQSLLAELFQQGALPSAGGFGLPALTDGSGVETLQKPKLLELLSVLQFKLPEVRPEWPPRVEALLGELRVGELLEGEEGGLYCTSERGDRLIVVRALESALWQEWRRVESQQQLGGVSAQQVAVQEAVQEALRWAERRNQLLEEQAAQLHLTVAWAQLLEVAVSRRFSLWGAPGKSEALFELLSVSLDAITSPDCSLQMALPLSQVAGTLMGKLQERGTDSAEESGEDPSGDVSYADLLSTGRLPTAACLALLSRLLPALLRQDSSETLRRRLYAVLLSFLQYTQSGASPPVPPAVMQALLLDGPAGDEEAGIAQLHRVQAELARGTWDLLRHEAGALVDVLARDAAHGSEVARALAYNVLAQLLAAGRPHHSALFLSQLQSRGLLQACLADVSKCSSEAVLLPSPASVRQLYTLEAQLGLLLQVATQGGQALLAMGALRQLGECRVLDLPLPDSAVDPVGASSALDALMPSPRERHHQLVGPVLRLLLCHCLGTHTRGGSALGKAHQDDPSALEAREFVRRHEALFARTLLDASPAARLADLEELKLTTDILRRVWPAQVAGSRAGLQELLFNAMAAYLASGGKARVKYLRQVAEVERSSEAPPAAREAARQMELGVARVRCHLLAYLHTLVLGQGTRLRAFPRQMGGAGVGLGRQPSLKQVVEVLQLSSGELEAAAEDRASLLTKLRDVNEMSRLQVEDAIKTYSAAAPPPSSDSLRKRRHAAMLAVVGVLAWRESHVASLLFLLEHALEILYAHFRDLPHGAPTGLSREYLNNGSLGMSHLAARVPSHTAAGLLESGDLHGAAGLDADGRAGEGGDGREALEAVALEALPTLERLQALDEERVGQSLEHVARLLKLLKASLFLDPSTALL